MRQNQQNSGKNNLLLSKKSGINIFLRMGHIAMFPEELPKRLIKMFSFTGETVFDPFASSSTTSLVAKNLGRNSIGYEINKNFEPIIREKFGVDQFNLDDDTKTFLQKTKLETFHLLISLLIFSVIHIEWIRKLI